MNKNKEKAFELRKLGKSYKAIHEELGISRSTLCDWFRHVSWSNHIMVSNTLRTRNPEHIKMMHETRSRNLDIKYKAVEAEAGLEYEKYKGEALFWAGLMIYAGEGDKRTKHRVRVTNTEFYLHKIFIAFAERYLGVTRDQIRFGLLLYPDLNESYCREMWSNLLGIKRENFYKTHVIEGKEKIKRLQYGIGMSIISNTVLKKKVIKWLALAHDERFALDAVIV